MSGIDYYHIKGYIVPETTKATNASTKMEAELNLPTAPMYRDGESYNGRSAIWLKHIVIGNVDGAEALAIRAMLRSSCPVLTMKGCPSLNQIGLEVNRGQNNPDGSSTTVLGAGSSRLEARGGFRDATFICPFNATHLEISDGVGGGLLNSEILNQPASAADGGGAGGTGAGTGANAPAHTQYLDNAKFFTEYYNQSVGNMADAVIVNNLWGKRQTFAFEGFKKNIFNAGQVESFDSYYGDISFELVIQPLKNEPIYRGLPDDDKLRRL